MASVVVAAEVDLRRYICVVVIFLVASACWAGEETGFEIFELSPPNSLGLRLSGDSEKGISNSSQFSLTLPREWVVFGSVGRSRYLADGVHKGVRRAAFGISSDSLRTFYFSLAVDRENSPENYRDSGGLLRLYWQPEGEMIKQFVFGVLAGARRFVFKSPRGSGAAKAEYDLPYQQLGMSVDWYVARNWDIQLEVMNYFFPDEVESLRAASVPLFIPSDTLNYAYGLPKTTTALAFGYTFTNVSKLRPRLSLGFVRSQSVVDDASTNSGDLGLSLHATKSIDVTTGIAVSRTRLSANEMTSVQSVNVGLSYNWR